MNQSEVRNYVERYFSANDCPTVERKPNYMTVQLSVEMDKLLMNRPFYWHYLEKTGGIPNPLTMTLITDHQTNNDLKGEYIHFGSPRLHQLFQSTTSLGSYIRMYENVTVHSGQSIPLQPWININAKVSFQCDRKKDVLLSLGLNLIHGQIVSDFHLKMMQTPLTPKLPDYCFTLASLIKPASGLIRLQKMVQTFANNEPDDWAIRARERWKQDLELLESFYEEYEEKPESYELEKQALKEQYEPRIEVEIINGGLFFLQKQVFTETNGHPAH
ncbi:YqhG family protein [Alkalicoccobacillus plakortidis]|uniref:YqhG family protein n=1 Tax=Alkalicoccobacillus plakortidis TaxID=444060 RepID=A0ABT0XGI6_9BACI|nr:YqhG family protein [Alkalicoccobacillus plakortidis]MCM2675008.1 YqhG family protein [Alkalicoccobacillus plakortidis]